MIGDVTSREAWEALRSDPRTVLVDVRTQAEWSFVGVPDLSSIGKRTALIAWQSFPSGEVDAAFVQRLEQAGILPTHRVLFLCRSGARSLSAAHAALGAGYADVANVGDGFEGPLDASGRRGRVCGWKAEDLPWRQS